MVTVADTTGVPDLKLLVIQRDSAAPLIATVAPIGTDSLSLQEVTNEFLDPAQALQETVVRVQNADSTDLTVDSISTKEKDEAARQAAAHALRRDTTKRDTTAAALDTSAVGRDTSAAARDTTAAASIVPVPTAPSATPATPGGRSQMPKAPKPPPSKSIVVYLSPRTPLKAGAKYTVTASGFRNLLGATKPSSHSIIIPKPAPPKPPPSKPPSP